MPQGKNIESIALEELFSQNSDGNIPILLDIEHEDIVWDKDTFGQFNGHLRLVNNNVAVMYEGKKYLPSSFSFEIPGEDGATVASTNITISAIDQRIIEVIRSISSKPKANIVAAFTSIDDTKIIFSKLFHYTFEMSNCTWDGVTARWTLTFDPAMLQNIPVDKASAARCPAAYEQNS